MSDEKYIIDPMEIGEHVHNAWVEQISANGREKDPDMRDFDELTAEKKKLDVATAKSVIEFLKSKDLLDENVQISDSQVSDDETVNEDVSKVIKLVRLFEEKMVVTPDDIHCAADSKEIEWDNDERFMCFCEFVTGESHLDKMTDQQLLRILQIINKYDKDEYTKLTDPMCGVVSEGMAPLSNDDSISRRMRKTKKQKEHMKGNNEVHDPEPEKRAAPKRKGRNNKPKDKRLEESIAYLESNYGKYPISFDQVSDKTTLYSVLTLLEEKCTREDAGFDFDWIYVSKNQLSKTISESNKSSIPTMEEVDMVLAECRTQKIEMFLGNKDA